MCGICCILYESGFKNYQEDKFYSLLDARGPDITNSCHVKLNETFDGFFYGSVLWLQGASPQGQPILDNDGNVFLWNGDNYNQDRFDDASDSKKLFEIIRDGSDKDILIALSAVKGPWSLIYYSKPRQKLYFGRDIFGRRSLLWSPPDNHKDSTGPAFILSSVSYRDTRLEELPALGLYVIDVHDLRNITRNSVNLYLFKDIAKSNFRDEDCFNIIGHFRDEFVRDCLNGSIPSESVSNELKSVRGGLQENLEYFQNLYREDIDAFDKIFHKAVRRRVLSTPRKCKFCTISDQTCSHTKIALMFSGGLDSSIIAYYLAKILPSSETIDLLNVSFLPSSNAVVESRSKRQGGTTKSPAVGEVSSPDRDSGLQCLKDLEIIFPERRWNFVEINVSLDELQRCREDVISHLIAPQDTVLDDSIGCALFFCGRGIGTIGDEDYHSPARVLFSGFGADEQLGGYSRHRGRFEEAGWSGLMEETKLELSRIHSRNCGRDDRVLSHHGRSLRCPFLDEDVVSYLNSLPMWKKSNLNLQRGFGEKLLLRVLAASLGLTFAASLPKKAIQFGSRIAKIENRKEKGGDSCRRLVV